MNERIQEFAEEAKIYGREYVAHCVFYDYDICDDEFQQRFESKFAELIVNACAEEANNSFENRLGYPGDYILKQLA